MPVLCIYLHLTYPITIDTFWSRSTGQGQQLAELGCRFLEELVSSRVHGGCG